MYHNAETLTAAVVKAAHGNEVSVKNEAGKVYTIRCMNGGFYVRDCAADTGTQYKKFINAAFAMI
jgi:hypothetical protein